MIWSRDISKEVDISDELLVGSFETSIISFSDDDMLKKIFPEMRGKLVKLVFVTLGSGEGVLQN